VAVNRITVATLTSKDVYSLP